MEEPSVFYQRGEVILAFLNAFKYFSGISFINLDVYIKAFFKLKYCMVFKNAYILYSNIFLTWLLTK